MSDAILLQHVYPNHGFLPFLSATFDRHAQYCGKHNIDYLAFVGRYSKHDISMGDWDKVYLVRDMLEKYSLVVYMDVDAFIKNLDVSLREVENPSDSIGACLFPTPFPHLNVGVLYFRRGEKVSRFIDRWLAGYPGSDDHYREQKVFNDIRDETVVQINDKWNSSYGHQKVDDPVVAAFHGKSNRLELMTQWLMTS